MTPPGAPRPPRGAGRARWTVLVLLLACGLLGGCAEAIEGRAVAEGQSGASSNPEFAKLLEECDVVSTDQMAEVLDSDFVDETFFGAICRYQAYGATVVDVTLAWFETGSLYRERATAERLGYSVSNTDVAGQSSILIRVPGVDTSCGVATRASDAGVIQWWVQSAGASTVDPCEAATRLADLAVRASY